MQANLSIDELELNIEIPDSLQWNESLVQKIVDQICEVFDSLESEFEDDQSIFDFIEIDLGIINSIEDFQSQLYYQIISYVYNHRFQNNSIDHPKEIQTYQFAENTWKERILLLAQNLKDSDNTIKEWVDDNYLSWNDWLKLFNDISINFDSDASFIDWMYKKWSSGYQNELIGWLANILQIEINQSLNKDVFFQSLDNLIISHYNENFITTDNSYFIQNWLENYLHRKLNQKLPHDIVPYKLSEWFNLQNSIFDTFGIPNLDSTLLKWIQKYLTQFVINRESNHQVYLLVYTLRILNLPNTKLVSEILINNEEYSNIENILYHIKSELKSEIKAKYSILNSRQIDIFLNTLFELIINQDLVISDNNWLEKIENLFYKLNIRIDDLSIKISNIKYKTNIPKEGLKKQNWKQWLIEIQEKISELQSSEITSIFNQEWDAVNSWFDFYFSEENDPIHWYILSPIYLSKINEFLKRIITLPIWDYNIDYKEEYIPTKSLNQEHWEVAYQNTIQLLLETADPIENLIKGENSDQSIEIEWRNWVNSVRESIWEKGLHKRSINNTLSLIRAKLKYQILKEFESVDSLTLLSLRQSTIQLWNVVIQWLNNVFWTSTSKNQPLFGLWEKINKNATPYNPPIHWLSNYRLILTLIFELNKTIPSKKSSNTLWTSWFNNNYNTEILLAIIELVYGNVQNSKREIEYEYDEDQLSESPTWNKLIFERITKATTDEIPEIISIIKDNPINNFSTTLIDKNDTIYVKEWETLLILPLLKKISNYLRKITFTEKFIIQDINIYHILISQESRLFLEKWLDDIIELEPSEYAFSILKTWIETFEFTINESTQLFNRLIDNQNFKKEFSENITALKIQLQQLSKSISGAQLIKKSETENIDGIDQFLSKLLIGRVKQKSKLIPSIENWASWEIPIDQLTESRYSWQFYTSEILDKSNREKLIGDEKTLTNWINKITIPGSSTVEIWAKANSLESLIDNFNNKATYQWDYTVEDHSKITEWIIQNIGAQSAVLFLNQIKLILAQTNSPITKIKWFELLIYTLRSINSNISFSLLNDFVIFLKSVLPLDYMEVEFLNISLTDILQSKGLNNSNIVSKEFQIWKEGIPSDDYKFLKHFFLNNPELNENDFKKSFRIMSGLKENDSDNYYSIFLNRLVLEFLYDSDKITVRSPWYKWIIHTLTQYLIRLQFHYSWINSSIDSNTILSNIWAKRSTSFITELNVKIEIHHPLFSEINNWKETLPKLNIDEPNKIESLDLYRLTHSILDIKIPENIYNKSELIKFLSEHINTLTAYDKITRYFSNINFQLLLDYTVHELIKKITDSNGSDSVWVKYESWITAISLVFIKQSETSLFFSSSGINKSDWFALLANKWNINNSKSILNKLVSDEIFEARKLFQIETLIERVPQNNFQKTSLNFKREIEKIWEITDFDSIINTQIDDIILQQTNNADSLIEIKNLWFDELVGILKKNYINEFEWKKIQTWVLLISIRIIQEKSGQLKLGSYIFTLNSWFELLGSRLNSEFINNLIEKANLFGEIKFIQEIIRETSLRNEIKDLIRVKFNFDHSRDDKIQKTEWLLRNTEKELILEHNEEIENPSIIRILEWQNFELIEAIQFLDEKLKLTYDNLLNSVTLSKDYDSSLLQIWESNLLLKLFFLDSQSKNIRVFKPVQKATLFHDLFTALYSIVSLKTKIKQGLGQNLLNNLLKSHVPIEDEIQLVDLNILKQNWDNTIIKIQNYLEKKTSINFDNRIPFLILFQELLSPSESFTFQGIELFFDTKTSKWDELSEKVIDRISLSETPWLGSNVQQIIDMLGFENTYILQSIILQIQWIYPQLENTLSNWFDSIIDRSTKLKSKDLIGDLLIPDILEIIEPIGLRANSSNKNLLNFLSIIGYQHKSNLSLSLDNLQNQINTIDTSNAKSDTIDKSSISGLNKIEELIVQLIFDKDGFKKTTQEIESIISLVWDNKLEGKEWIKNAILSSLEIDTNDLPNLQVEIDLNNNSFQTNKTIKDELERGTRFTSKCAGIILLSPFYATLFRRMNLLEKNEFIDTHAQLIAYQSLIEILRIDEILPVDIQDLVVRLITGIQPELEITKLPSLSSEQKEEIRNFINAVKSQWAQVNGMTLRGFIETYLHRTGSIWKESSGKWLIKIDGHGSDILLQTLPWGFATMKFPWTSYMVITEWDVP